MLKNEENIYRRFYVDGAFTNDIALAVLSMNIKEVIVNHSSSIVISDEIADKIENSNVKVSVLAANNIILLTINPISTSNYHFDSLKFKEKLNQHIDLPIIDVCEVK